MEYLNSDSLLYLVLIAVFLAIFIWNKRRSKKNRENLKTRSFKRRYDERKKKRD